jgi:hypothetical protein
MGQKIFPQSAEVGAVTFDLFINLADNILQDPRPCRLRVHNNDC